MAKKLRRKNRSRWLGWVERCLFLQVNYSNKNSRQMKKAVKKIVGKLTWPQFLKANGLTEKWENFLAERRKSVDSAKEVNSS